MQPSSSAAESSRWERAAHPFAIVLFVTYALLIALHASPPFLGDFQTWVSSGKLLALHLHGHPDSVHILKRYPVPNSTLTALLGLLCSVLPWKLAARTYLLLQLLLSYCAIRYLCRTVNASPLLWYIAPGVIFFSLGFWYGLFAFQLGMVLLLFFAASLLRCAEGQGRSEWLLALLLLLLFFTHMVPFTFACLLLLLYALQTRNRFLPLLLVPAGILLAWYVSGRLRNGNQDSAAAPTTAVRWLSARFAVFKANTIAKSFGIVNPSSLRPAYSVALQFTGKPLFLLLFICNGIACVTFLVLLVRSARRGIRHGSHTRFFWQAVALSLLVYLLVPESLLGISDPGARILQTALWTALFLSLRNDRASRIAAASAGIMAVAGCLLFSQLAWTSRPLPPRLHLPQPIELLGKVPYAYASAMEDALNKQVFDIPVFPTGLFLNSPAKAAPIKSGAGNDDNK